MEACSTEFRIVTSDSRNEDFLDLITLLDSDLNETNGAEQQQYDKFNKVDYIKDVILIYSGGSAIACGAFKEYDSGTVELKRIFVKRDYRNKGLAKSIVKSLEQLAETKGYKFGILETGKKQMEAIHLYQKLGYVVIDNFLPYVGMENSVCMKKELKNSTEG